MIGPLMRDAKRLHRDGRFADAAGLYQRVLRANPKHPEALYGLGMAHAQKGYLHEAEHLVGEAVAVAPDFAEAWRARALMLMHLGRPKEASASIERALALKPDFKEALALRDDLLAQLATPHDGLAAVDRALARDPDNAADWNRRGSLLVSLRRLDEALLSYDRALSIEPDFVEALSNRATVLFESNRLDDALSSFDAALALQPDLAIGWNNRGNTLAKMNRFEEALESFDRALALEPDLPSVRENRDFVLFETGRASRGPAKYIRGLFDSFSSYYDEKMLVKLEYRGHLHLRELADRVLPKGSLPWRILDLGCGTGLAGSVFKDLAQGGRLDGIDLSPRMLEGATARQIYDDLICDDIETVLLQTGPAYSLILSADSIIYFGDLTALFSGVARRLEPQGFFLFSTEAKPGEGWDQSKVHRFRHSEAYLRAEAACAGLEFVEIVQATIRREEKAPVPGFAVALQKLG